MARNELVVEVGIMFVCMDPRTNPQKLGLQLANELDIPHRGTNPLYPLSSPGGLNVCLLPKAIKTFARDPRFPCCGISGFQVTHLLFVTHHANHDHPHHSDCAACRGGTQGNLEATLEHASRILHWGFRKYDNLRPELPDVYHISLPGYGDELPERLLGHAKRHHLHPPEAKVRVISANREPVLTT